MPELLLRVSLIVLVSACGYRPGSFKHGLYTFDGERRTVGCLEVGVASRTDPAARGPISKISFGNRCDAPVVVDFGAIRATAYDDKGRPTKMVAYDPNREIRPLRMDGRMAGHESIEWLPVGQLQAPPVQLCLDLVGLDADDTATRPVITCIPAYSSLAAASGDRR